MIPRSLSYFIILLPLLAGCSREAGHAQGGCFENPLMKSGADPWIINRDSVYHYCYSANQAVFIKSSGNLVKINEASARKIWEGVPGTSYSNHIWAPELHFLENRWYVYFAADDGNNAAHRMYVLESASEDVNSDFRFMGRLETENDRWAIDGTVLTLDQRLFFIWSGWDSTINVSQGIYIQEMSSPKKIMEHSQRVLISEPEYAWEKKGSPDVNEGPEVLKSSQGTTHLVYSASGSWTNHYCLGMLRLDGDDPLTESAWQKYPKPVFKGNRRVISPGHCSFTRIGKEDWILYHAAKTRGAGWDRYIKMQKYRWVDDSPCFGAPVPDGECIEVKY